MRLAAVVVSVGVATSAWAGTALERIEVVRTGPLAVRLHLSAPVTTVAKTLPPEGTRPDRIYLDLPDTSVAGVPAEVAGAESLLRVRAAQFDLSTTRVVLDLASAVPFVVRPDGRTITIELAPPAAAPVSPAAPAPPQVTAVPETIPVPERIAPAQRLVVLDPGHGGNDPGATGISGVMEKTITLDIAKRVATLLAGNSVDVVLTREQDTYVTIDERVARATDAAVFVSLHANAAADPTLSGVEVFYGGGVETTAAGAHSPLRLGQDVQRSIRRRVGSVRTTVRPGTFAVLTRNAVPGVLVEIGYLTNPTDAIRLQTEGYRAQLARAIADAATRFVRAPTEVATR
jgi:N-acetylmuramoyl-L-alanine amidase